MDDEEKIELLRSALIQLLASVEYKCVTVGDCNQARNALEATQENDGHPLCKDHAQLGMGA